MKVKYLLLVFVVLAAISTSIAFGEQNDPPVQVEYVKASRIKVPVGELVTVHVTLKATGGPVNGELKVEVRKDYENGADTTYKTLTKYISLDSGETREITVGTFVAQDLTGDGWITKFRQYFIKVYFNGQELNIPYNTDPNIRPCVETYEVSGTAQYVSSAFSASNGQQI